MYRALLFFLIVLANISHGGVVGGGDVTLGLSKDQDVENIGLAGSYRINFLGVNQSAFIGSQFQLGSDRGRSSVATLVHDYQYEQSYLQTHGSLGHQFISPALNWLFYFTNRQEFKNATDEQTNETKTDFGRKDNNWSISTGPSLNIDRNWPINFMARSIISKQKVSDINSEELEISIEANKSITKFTSSALAVLRTCVDYDSPGNEDTCRDELTGIIQSKKKSSEYKIEYGLAEQNDSKTEIYEVTFDYELNTATNISIIAYQSIYNINEATNSTLGFVSSEYNSIQRGESFYYQYDRGRQALDLKYRRIKSTINEAEPIQSKSISAFYSLKTSSRFCRACEITVGHEFSQFESGDELNKQSLSISKSHSKRISTALSVDHTKQSNDLDVWSISVFLTYTGRLSKLGTR